MTQTIKIRFIEPQIALMMRAYPNRNLLANALAGPEPQDWQWIGPHMSQRMFGITERRARNYAARHGGVASRISADPVDVAWARKSNRE
jgi:hypothetical protein